MDRRAAAGDWMRVISVGMIGWYHIWQQSWLSPVFLIGSLRVDFSGIVRAGYMFVDLMILLSGFLIYLPYARHEESAPAKFYARRAARILPSYGLCLIVMLATTLVSGQARPTLWKDLLAHLGFVHNLFGFSYTQSQLNVVLWTLAVEVQFYAIAPALAPFFRKHPLPCYALMCGLAFSFRGLWTANMAETTLFVNRLPNMLDVYANGMLAAHLYAQLEDVREHRGWIALAGTALAIVAAWAIVQIVWAQSRVSGYENIRAGQMRWRWLLTACGGAFLVGGSVSFRPVKAVLSNRLVRWLSGISFNFYIWHQWLAVQLKKWRIPPYAAESNPNQAGEMPWQLWYTLTCFAAALLVAYLLTRFVEEPAGRRLRAVADKAIAKRGKS